MTAKLTPLQIEKLNNYAKAIKFVKAQIKMQTGKKLTIKALVLSYKLKVRTARAIYKRANSRKRHRSKAHGTTA